jgi:hypothetical protein
MGESQRNWEQFMIDIDSHIRIASELNDMLGKGLFSCAGDMVFKVI